jgi:RNA polymerase sigma-70 factor (ECF subfamily)
VRDQELLSQHLPMIYRMAWTLTGNEADAEDLAHDTMVAALTSLGRFRAESKLSTWLASILMNRHRTDRRRFAARARLQGRVRAARPAPADPPQDVEDLRRAVARLDDDERALLALSIDRELDSATIGRMVGRPAGTVRSQLHDVREKLRRLMSERQPHES